MLPKVPLMTVGHPSLLVLLLVMSLTLLLPAVTHSGEDLTQLSKQRPLDELEHHYRQSVLGGWRSFQTSFARDGVACVNCHPDHRDMRRWAGAYPKVEVFDGTPYEVKGLRQVVLEALERHTDLLPVERLSLVEDLVAFISWWGDGEPVSPGRSRPFSPAAGDLSALESSVLRGKGFFHQEGPGSCAECHEAGEKATGVEKIALSGAVTRFPRYVAAAGQVLSVEAYLSRHLEGRTKMRYPPDSGAITDLVAYLASLCRGERLSPGARIK